MDNINQPVNRSYGQFCALARALDVIGDRWNLLIVRELLAGPLRYNEIKISLTGIASNLLAARLRSLEGNGIIERRLGDEGVLYALTPWGEGLREPMEALGRWGVSLMIRGRGDDSFQPRWLVLALPALLRGATASPALELGLEVDDFLIALQIDNDGPRAIAQPTHSPNTILTATPETVVGLAAGAITVDQAVSAGHLQGDVSIVHRVFPATRPNALEPQ